MSHSDFSDYRYPLLALLVFVLLGTLFFNFCWVARLAYHAQPNKCQTYMIRSGVKVQKINSTQTASSNKNMSNVEKEI
jgi:hypothetical protein